MPLPTFKDYCEAIASQRDRVFVSHWKWNHPQRLSTQQRTPPPRQRVPPVSHVAPTKDKEQP